MNCKSDFTWHHDVKDKPGGIFIRSGEQVSTEDRILFQAVSGLFFQILLERWRNRSNGEAK
jgi:hypothetical protein